MRLRRATLADVELLAYWDTKPHVVRASGADAGGWDWSADIPQQSDCQELLIAEIDGRPVGMLQIIDPTREATHYWGSVASDLRAIDIWIGEEADLGRGHGTRMMRLALARCFASGPVTAVLIDPLATNTRAIRFYERQGFLSVERRTFGEDDCLVMRLDRAEWQRRRADGP